MKPLTHFLISALATAGIFSLAPYHGSDIIFPAFAFLGLAVWNIEV